MRLLKNVSLMAITSMLAACAAGPQPYRSAQLIEQSNKYTVSHLQDSMASDQSHRFLDKEHTVYYEQNFGGGGVALGVLLGPLGALANVEAIKSETNKDAAVLQDKLPVDVTALFHASLDQAATLAPATPGASAPELAPALFVQKLADEHIRFASMLVVTEHVSGKSILRKYFYVLPESYPKEALLQGLTPTQIAQLSADVRIGFDWIVATYARDVDGTFKPGTKAQMHSDFVSPRFQFASVGYSFDAGPGRVGFAMQIADFTTVYSLPKDVATLTM
jgi:hypothetical protein